jgi:hypothetical protein
MSVEKFLAAEKLFEYLDIEVKQVLSRHDIHGLYDYAWDDEHTANSEFVGLAKWSLDGLHSLTQENAALKFYTQKQFESLNLICTDLDSLMEVARLAIGNALWMAELVKERALDDNHYFWLNQISSVTLLGMASDRVRDLFLAITFKMTFYDYKASRKGKLSVIDSLDVRQFQYPFLDAKNRAVAQEIKVQLERLQTLVSAINDQRKVRNITVHEVATRAGVLTKQYFDQPRADKAFNQIPSVTALREVSEKIHEDHRETIATSLDNVTAWYQNLARAVACIFDIEHTLRVKGHQEFG